MKVRSHHEAFSPRCVMLRASRRSIQGADLLCKEAQRRSNFELPHDGVLVPGLNTSAVPWMLRLRAA